MGYPSQHQHVSRYHGKVHLSFQILLAPAGLFLPAREWVYQGAQLCPAPVWPGELSCLMSVQHAGKTESLGRVGSSEKLQPTPGFAPAAPASVGVSTNPSASENGGTSQSGWDDIDAGEVPSLHVQTCIQAASMLLLGAVEFDSQPPQTQGLQSMR